MDGILSRLNAVKHKQMEAIKLNNKAIVEEDRLKSLPANHARRQERLDRQVEKLESQQELEKQGRNYEAEQSLNYTAEDCDRWERKKRKHLSANSDVASPFTSCDRQYYTLTKRLKVDMNSYNELKERMNNEDFYAGSGSLIHGTHKPSDEAIDRLVKDLEVQAIRRQKASRRRIIDPDADIDYINERNREYNEKIERFFGKYTAEIKQNLERGTAV